MSSWQERSRLIKCNVCGKHPTEHPRIGTIWQFGRYCKAKKKKKIKEIDLPVDYPVFPIPQEFGGKNQCEKLLSFFLSQAHLNYECNQMIDLENGTTVEVDHIIENILIVEVNGSIHNTRIRKMLDMSKIEEIRKLGYITLSFKDSEIQDNPHNVITKIKAKLNEQQSRYTITQSYE